MFGGFRDLLSDKMGLGVGAGRGRYSGKKCRLVSMFSLTTAFFLVEIVVGKFLKLFFYEFYFL